MAAMASKWPSLGEIEAALEAAGEIGLELRKARRIDNLVLLRHPRVARQFRRVPRLRHDQRAVDDHAGIRLAPECEPLTTEIAHDRLARPRPRIRAQSSPPPSGSKSAQTAPALSSIKRTRCPARAST